LRPHPSKDEVREEGKKGGPFLRAGAYIATPAAGELARFEGDRTWPFRFRFTGILNLQTESRTACRTSPSRAEVARRCLMVENRPRPLLAPAKFRGQKRNEPFLRGGDGGPKVLAEYARGWWGFAGTKSRGRQRRKKTFFGVSEGSAGGAAPKRTHIDADAQPFFGCAHPPAFRARRLGWGRCDPGNNPRKQPAWPFAPCSPSGHRTDGTNRIRDRHLADLREQ